MTTASSRSRQAHADAVASQLGTRLCSGTFIRRSGPSDGLRPGSVTLLSSRNAAPREICSFTPVPRAVRSSSPPVSLSPNASHFLPLLPPPPRLDQTNYPRLHARLPRTALRTGRLVAA